MKERVRQSSTKDIFTKNPDSVLFPTKINAGHALALGFAFISVAAAAYFLGAQSKTPVKSLTYLPTPSSTNQQAIIPTTSLAPTTQEKAPSQVPTRTPSVIRAPITKPVVNGKELSHISYTLPPAWNARIEYETLFISPERGGGEIAIGVYDFPQNASRREFFCKVTQDMCISGETYFEQVSIGNISGYLARRIDASGGGDQYFGAKGNKFYHISTYIPSYPPAVTEFGLRYKDVLNSLVF